MDYKPSYITVIEYKEYDNIYQKDFVNQLVNKEICSINNGKIKFKATGILIYKNNFIIIFPKNYNLPMDEENTMQHAQILFQVLLKYKREANLSPEEMELLNGENGQYKEDLYTAYQLFLDFIQNGPLKRVYSIKSSSYSGRINWTATVNLKQPIFSGDSVIYNEPISQKTTFNSQDLLSKLHHYCVSKGIKKYGWLFGASLEDLNIEEEMPCDINYAINFLTKELNNTFIEREIKVISILISYLSGIALEEFEEKVYILVTPYFHNVWESICGQIFNNQYNTLKQIIPKLKWEINSNAKVQSQRPDIMVIRDKELYILDAKYYNIDENLPGWADIVKQLFYAFTISMNMRSGNITLTNETLKQRIQKVEIVENAFLFPSGEVEPIKYIGKVSIEENIYLGHVKSYKINTFLAMKCYIGKEKYDFISQIAV